MLGNFSWIFVVCWFFSYSTSSKRFLKNSNRFEYSHLNMLSAFDYNKQIKFSGQIMVKQDSSLKDSYIPGHRIPWPWSVLWLWVYTNSLRVTFEWCKNENLTNGWGDLKDMKFKGKFLDLEVWPWHWVCIAESLVTEMNIWVKFNENLSKGSGDMERTRIEG